MSTRIGILGVSGRMGRALVGAVLARDKAQLIGGSETGAEAMILDPDGKPTGLVATADTRGLFEAADVLIDFTTPEATRRHAKLAAETGKALVIGTTGLTDADEEAVADAARIVPVLQAANFSLGVALLMDLVRRAAKTLGPEFDIEILEMHHRHKVDAPSGTALALGRAAAEGRGVALEDAACLSREGHTGARPTGEIGFATMRGGDVAGEHLVVFAGEGERLELGHRAGSRMIFARGAVKAALWLHGRPAGRYSLTNLLNN